MVLPDLVLPRQAEAPVVSARPPATAACQPEGQAWKEDV